MKNSHFGVNEKMYFGVMTKNNSKYLIHFKIQLHLNNASLY